MNLALLYVSIREVNVEFNGDETAATGSRRTPAAADNPSAQDNLIIATLQYPRPGAPVVSSTKALDLPSGRERRFDDSEFWEALLFKETVLDETVLQLVVSDRDNRSAFLKILGFVMSVGLGGVVGASIKGITNLVLGGIATGASTPLLGTLKTLGGKGNTQVIGETAKVSIRVNGESISVTPSDAWDGVDTLKLPFVSPRELHYLDISDPERERRTMVQKGALNGYVTLSLRVEKATPAVLPV